MTLKERGAIPSSMAIRMNWGVARDAADATRSATNAPEASALYDRKYPRARRTAPSPPAKSSCLREPPGELPSRRHANPSYPPHLGCVLGAHEDDYSLVSRLVIRILVHPEVLLRHRVDVVEVKVFVDANDLRVH